MSKIQLKTRTSSEIVAVEDIIRIEAAGNFSLIYIDGDTKRISKKISYYEIQLLKYDFIRIHNSHLVNVDRIKLLKKGRKKFVVLDDGTELPISKKYNDKLIERLSEEFKKI